MTLPNNFLQPSMNPDDAFVPTQGQAVPAQADPNAPPRPAVPGTPPQTTSFKQVLQNKLDGQSPPDDTYTGELEDTLLSDKPDATGKVAPGTIIKATGVAAAATTTKSTLGATQGVIPKTVQDAIPEAIPGSIPEVPELLTPGIIPDKVLGAITTAAPKVLPDVIQKQVPSMPLPPQPIGADTMPSTKVKGDIPVAPEKIVSEVAPKGSFMMPPQTGTIKNTKDPLGDIPKALSSVIPLTTPQENIDAVTEVISEDAPIVMSPTPTPKPLFGAISKPLPEKMSTDVQGVTVKADILDIPEDIPQATPKAALKTPLGTVQPKTVFMPEKKVTARFSGSQAPIPTEEASPSETVAVTTGRTADIATETPISLPGNALPDAKSLVGENMGQSMGQSLQGDTKGLKGRPVEQAELITKTKNIRHEEERAIGQVAPQVLGVGIAQVQPQMAFETQGVVQAEAPKTTTASRVETVKLIEKLVESIVYTIKDGKTETVVTLNQPPIFSGVSFMVTQYDSATKEFNLSFMNLNNPDARILIESTANQAKLRTQLAERGYTVHMVTIEPKTNVVVATEEGEGDRGEQDSEEDTAGGSDTGSTLTQK